MVDLNASLEHHVLQVSVAQGIGQVPTDTKQDGGLFKAVSFEVDNGGRTKRCWASPQLTQTASPPLAQQNHPDSPLPYNKVTF